MDDDIDIEEHDVLDNPRIKSMFPDLSRVKIEVPDDDEMEVYNSEEVPEDCPKIQLVYQYDYNSVTETEHTDNHLSEYDNTDNKFSEYENPDHNAEENELPYEVIDSGQTIEGYSEAAEDQSYDDSHNVYGDDEYCQIDSQPDYIPNKIIVGSKPNKIVYDYETLYEEALNSQAVVYLENWSERLNRSVCYCNICKTLFSTVNTLDAHKMVSHSYLVAVQNNTARKSTTSGYIIPPTQSIARKSTTTGPGRLCNHCNNVFPNDTTLIKHLYELLPMNNFTDQSSVARSSKIGVKIPAPDLNLHKKIDDKNYNTKVGVNKTQSVVVKKNYVKSVDSVAVTKPSVVSTKIKKNINTTNAVAKIIAKTKNPLDVRQAYFKCTLCHAILDSKRSATKHREAQHPTFKKLHIYHKVFKPEVNKRVRMKGKIDPSFIPISVLFKCGKCQIHVLSPYAASQHFIVCNKVSAEDCTICHRQIIRKDTNNHSLQHDYCSDSIKVYTVNRAIYERVLCQCPTCGVCFEELPFWVHITCCTPVDSVHCSTCDINIVKTRYRRHEIKHRIRKFTKNDFIIILYFYHKSPASKHESPPKMVVNKYQSVETDKKVIFYCPYCKCCQKRQSLKGHKDKQCVNWKMGHKRICDKCGLMFTHKPYVDHRLLHEGNKFKLSDYDFVNIFTATKIAPPVTATHECKNCKVNFIWITQLSNHKCGEEKFRYCSICNKKFHPKSYLIHKQIHSEVEIMPELLLKYDSLRSTWNLMYMCSDCELVCLSYDSAVEHSQKHIIYAADTSVYCNICNLAIHESFYRVHADLHETNSRLTIDSFKILKYDFKKLFNNEWMDFGDLTEQDMNVILAKSVYKNVRNVKMNATGDSDAVKYCCSNCKISVDDVKTHLNGQCKDNERYRCKYCKTKIDDVNDLVAHELRHENTRDEFKIVTFNDDQDRKLNAKLKKYSSKADKLSRKRENRKTDKDKKFKAYRCRKCSVCITLKQNMRIHRCLSDKKHFCKLCNQYFTYKFRSNHEIAHQKFPNLSKKTLSIIYFNDGCITPDTEHDLQDICSPRTSKIFKIVKSSDEKDTKIKLKLKKQTSRMIKNDKKYRVYCCRKCNVCVTIKQNIKLHKCTSKKFYCNNCNQYFSYNIRANHQTAHLNFPNLCKKTLTVSYFGNHTVKEVKTNAPDDISDDTPTTVVLYRCDCNIHCNSLKTIKKHTAICNSTNIVKEKCTKCGLLFAAKDFSSHSRDHDKEFVIKIVIKTDWYQCSNCEILFLTENEVGQHHDNCDPKLGVECQKCGYKYLRNCINSHKCSENETHLYISTVISIDQNLKEFKVYSCTKCDINYWSHDSYKKHVYADHSLRRKKVFCKICRLYFTKMSNSRHSVVHRDCKEYKIKVINPVTNQYKVLRGKNVAAKYTRNEPNPRDRETNESNEDSIDINSSRKRKIDSNNEDHINSAIIVGSKKTKVSEDNGPNTDTHTEIDGNNTLKNITKKSNTTKVINRVIMKKTKDGAYIRNNNSLFKCSKCPLHYLQLESLKTHMYQHQNRTVEHLECSECHLKFTPRILTKHKHLHHKIHKFSLADFDIRCFEIKKKSGILVEIKIDNFNDSNTVDSQDRVIDDSAVDGTFNDSNIEVDSQDGVIDDSAVAGVSNDSNTDIESSIDDSQDSVVGINNKIVENETLKPSTIDLDDKTIAIENLKVEIRLFKCGNCNVCFITQQECLQHVDKHETIDSKYYISCKICNFQFMICSLKLHMETHHDNEFKLEDLMIEEYTVVGDDLDTRIDVYYAIDRVQSRLISTTTDEGKDDL